VAGNSLWVSDEFDATLDRIDPQTPRVVGTVHLGSSPQGMVVTGSGDRVAARPFAAASHLGGTLTVMDGFLPETDPARAYDPASTPTLATVYDGLTAFRRSGEAPGLTLVPDMARSLPRPADGGTTFTFSLRRGIRYSTGDLLRASDIRRGIQRELSFGGPSAYYEGILGGSACGQHPRRCDLSAGIITNDAAGTVTFCLAQPDPDFLYKLALPVASPAPPGVSRSLHQPGAVPARHRPVHDLASQAEQIHDPRAQSVLPGRADVTPDGDDRSLAIQYPAHVHVGLRMGTAYAFLNTRQPPFTNIKGPAGHQLCRRSGADHRALGPPP
jgi:hypothetical protein